MKIRGINKRAGDVVYLLERADNGKPYHDPGRGDKDDPDTWWFQGDELRNKDAWQTRARRKHRDSCILS